MYDDSVIGLIKAAHAHGEPLFKGDVVGHEFHGNQYTEGGGGGKGGGGDKGGGGKGGDVMYRLRDEGVAYRAADEASKKANKENTVEAHMAAAQAHDKARRQTRFERDESYHVVEGNKHRVKANNLRAYGKS